MAKYEVHGNISYGLCSGFVSVAAATSIFRAITDLFENTKDFANDPSLLVKKYPDLIFSGRITKVVSDRIIRPVIVISDKLKYMDKKDLTNIIKFNINMYGAYLLQAIKILANIYNVDVSMLSRVMTNRSMFKTIYKITKDMNPGTESNEDNLTSIILKEYGNKLTAGILDNDEDEIDEVEEDRDEKPSSRTKTSSKVDFKTVDPKSLGTPEELFKVIELDLVVKKDVDGDKSEIKVSLPFIIAPIIVYTDSETFLRNVLGNESKESFSYRWLQYKSGEINLSDLIFASDLIREYKENKIRNKNDVAKLIQDNLYSESMHSVITREGSFATYNQIYIFDRSDQYLVEELIQDNLLDPEVWQDLALSLKAFSINFVDNDEEALLNYITDMPTYNVLTFRQIKKDTNKNDDLIELMKAMLVNKNPF